MPTHARDGHQRRKLLCSSLHPYTSAGLSTVQRLGLNTRTHTRLQSNNHENKWNRNNNDPNLSINIKWKLPRIPSGKYATRSSLIERFQNQSTNYSFSLKSVHAPSRYSLLTTTWGSCPFYLVLRSAAKWREQRGWETGKPQLTGAQVIRASM